LFLIDSRACRIDWLGGVLEGRQIRRNLSSKGWTFVGINTSTRLIGDVVIIDTIGELRLGEGTNVLRQVVNETAEQGYKNILLNLRDVRHIDSAGVGELMSCYTSVRNRGGHLKLMNLSKNVHNLLQITKLYTIFEVEDDEPTAVASFR
jgi:anti-sigma B factor antagonist